MATDAERNKETDARFWAITGYQPGHKLDPHNALDALMIPVWKAIYDEVVYQDIGGLLQLTYNHPEIASAIDAATQHIFAVQHALDAAHALQPGSPAHGQNIAAAGAAHSAAQSATKAAGAALPTPVVTQAALPVAKAVVQTGQAVQHTVAQMTPATTQDVHRAMQASAMPAHAMDVAKAHGLNFQMDASGHGIQVAPGASPSIVPAGAGGGDPASVSPPASPGAPHAASSWTPLIAFGAVAAALGIGAAINSGVSRVRRPRRTRMGPAGRMIVVR